MVFNFGETIMLKNTSCTHIPHPPHTRATARGRQVKWNTQKYSLWK